MNQTENTQPRSDKPLAAFVIILFLALFVGGWLYITSVRNGLQARIDELTAQIAAMSASGGSAAGGKAASPIPAADPNARTMPPTDGWQTLGDILGTYTFQLDTPPGYHLKHAGVETAGMSAYVVLDPTSENGSPTPDMVITLVDLTAEPYASKLGKNDEPGTRFVQADNRSGFWITGWEDQAWPDFARAAASFRTP